MNQWSLDWITSYPTRSNKGTFWFLFQLLSFDKQSLPCVFPTETFRAFPSFRAVLDSLTRPLWSVIGARTTETQTNKLNNLSVGAHFSLRPTFHDTIPTLVNTVGGWVHAFLVHFTENGQAAYWVLCPNERSTQCPRCWGFGSKTCL